VPNKSGNGATKHRIGPLRRSKPTHRTDQDVVVPTPRVGVRVRVRCVNASYLSISDALVFVGPMRPTRYFVAPFPGLFGTQAPSDD